MTENEMLEALQADVDAWPQAVKSAGVKNAAGSSYAPQARNNEVLRTPDDPRATYEYMVRAWSLPDAESGSAGWVRILPQAGPQLTWEWFIADPDKPYAPLFPDELRERVRAALDANEGTHAYKKDTHEKAVAAGARDERIARIQEEMRSGKRSRPRY
jgi:hypothetical protein